LKCPEPHMEKKSKLDAQLTVYMIIWAHAFGPSSYNRGVYCQWKWWW